MNYAELKTAVEDYVENTFSATDFATMTELAEQRIYNSAQILALRKNVTGNLTAGNKFLTAPSDFLSVFSMAVVAPSGDYTYLLNKDANFIREAYPSSATQGLPRYYALFGLDSATLTNITFILSPTPDAAFPVELNYFYYPESIVTANTTWLGNNFDSVLFNGVMVEVARFMKQDAETIANADKEYERSLILLKNLGDGKNRQDAYRSGQIRTKVV